MTLEVKAQDGTRQDINDLRRRIMYHGREIIGHAATCDLSLFAPQAGVKDLDKILEAAKDCRLYEDEKSWLDRVKKYRDHLASFDIKKVRSLIFKGDEQAEYSLRFGMKAALLLKPVMEGYVSTKHSLCPSCPQAKNNVTWESWKEFIDPVCWFFNENKAMYFKI